MRKLKKSMWVGIIIVNCMLVAAMLGVAAGAMQETPIDLARYVGLWYEFARTPNLNQDNTPTESGKTFSTCTATTATYTIQDGSSLAIRNQCTRRASDGTIFEDMIEGSARVVDGGGGRRLKIAFGSALSQFFQRLISFGGFNYWIYEVGEASLTAPYTWAVVSGPDRDFIFLLTRDRVPSPEIKTQVLGAARRAGLPVDKLVYKQE